MDERTLINAAIAMSSGIVAALGSHFNLRGRVNNLEKTESEVKKSQAETRQTLTKISADVAYIRGRMDEGNQ